MYRNEKSQHKMPISRYGITQERRTFVPEEREREYTWRDEERLPRWAWYAEQASWEPDDPEELHESEETFASLMRGEYLTPQLQKTVQQMGVALTQMRRDAHNMQTTRYHIFDGTLLSRMEDTFTYQGTTKTPLPLQKQASIAILVNERTREWLDGRITVVTDTTVSFTTQTEIPSSLLKQFTLVEDTDWLLKRQQEALLSCFGEMKGQLCAKVFGYLPARYGLVSLEGRLEPFTPNEEQRQGTAHALGSEVTMIIGPGGTGKSYVLTNAGRLLLQQEPQSILLTSHTNIATDHLFIEMVDTLEKSGDERVSHLLAEGRIVRSGTPQDKRLQEGGAYFHLTVSAIAHQHLGPQFASDDAQAQQRLQEIVQQMEDGKHTKNFSKLQEEKTHIENQLRLFKSQVAKMKTKVLQQASLIAATGTEMYLNSTLLKHVFETVIVDEISMVPLIEVLLVVIHATQRVIVAGDPRQLDPIFKTACKEHERAKVMPEAVQWLAQDLYTYHRVTIEDAEKGKKGCVLLKEQRRTHPIIVAPLNHLMYKGVLTNHPQTLYAPPIAPLPACPLLLVDTSKAQDSKTRKPSSGQARTNVHHVQVVAALVPQILATLPKLPSSADFHRPQIGILAPYRSQVQLIRQALEKAGLAQYVHVGTVHTVQSLEFEVVIFDTVEAPRMQPYSFTFDKIQDTRGMPTTASRVLNVGHGRAKHKLIYLAHRDHLNQYQPNNPEGNPDKQRLVVELVNWAYREGHISSAKILDPSLGEEDEDSL